MNAIAFCLLVDKLNVFCCVFSAGYGDTSTWCFSQIKGALDDDVTDADIISCVEFNHDGELLATGDKGGRVVIFQVGDVNKVKLESTSRMQPKPLLLSFPYREILPQKPPYQNVVNTTSIQHFSHTSRNSII